MIRFRIGQSWKRERAAPQDGFALEVDGVNLLAGAGEEPLARVVPELVDAVHALFTAQRDVSQLSLPEAHLELVFLRDEDQAELSIVSLARPARIARPPLRIDLQALATAAARCARTLLADLDAAAPDALRPAARRRLVQRTEKLEDGELADRERTASGGWSFEQFARTPGSFGFRIVDPKDRLLTFDRTAEAPLASLLVGGGVSLRLGQHVVWTAEAHPFLFAVELSRQAGELAHALELGEAQLRLRPGGVGDELSVALRAERVTSAQGTFPLAGAALVRGMVELSLAIAGAAASRNKVQARNPYLQELTARARESLTHLQPPHTHTRGKAAAERRKSGGAAHKPLPLPGRVRRLRFEPRWEHEAVGGEGDARLLLSSQGPIIVAPELAIGLTSAGELRFRRAGPRGVAVAADDGVLVAENDRLLFFEGAAEDARWLRRQETSPLGAELIRKDGLLLTIAENRTVLAFSEVTGRELWRAVPPRTQRAHLLVQGHRALVATDAGHLFGLELRDGQIRYRIRAPLPFRSRPVSWGRRLLAVGGRGSQHALFAADAHSGEIAWEQELELSRPSAPLAVGARAFVAGERGGEGVLLCHGTSGKRLWERALHLGHGPYSLKPVGRSLLVTSQTGAASLIGADGQVEWHLGAAGEPVSCLMPAAVSRGVVILPGEQVRAVDPRGGHVLAEVKAGHGLCDLRADARLNLYLLDDAGALRSFRLATQLAVVGGGAG